MAHSSLSSVGAEETESLDLSLGAEVTHSLDLSVGAEFTHSAHLSRGSGITRQSLFTLLSRNRSHSFIGPVHCSRSKSRYFNYGHTCVQVNSELQIVQDLWRTKCGHKKELLLWRRVTDLRLLVISQTSHCGGVSLTLDSF